MKLFEEFRFGWQESSIWTRLLVAFGFYPLVFLIATQGPFWGWSLIAFVAIVAFLRWRGIWPNDREVNLALAASAMIYVVASLVWWANCVLVRGDVPIWQIAIMGSTMHVCLFAAIFIIATTVEASPSMD